MNKSKVYFFQVGVANCWYEILQCLLSSDKLTSNILGRSFSAWLLQWGDKEQSPSPSMMNYNISKKQAFAFDDPLAFRTHLSFNRPEPVLTDSHINKIY